jgi:hypothetical protein
MIPPTHGLPAGEAKDLETELRRKIKGEVRFDAGSIRWIQISALDQITSQSRC